MLQLSFWYFRQSISKATNAAASLSLVSAIQRWQLPAHLSVSPGTDVWAQYRNIPLLHGGCWWHAGPCCNHMTAIESSLRSLPERVVCWRGRGRSFHVQGPKMKEAREPTVVCVCKIPCCQPDVVCVCKIPCCQPDVVCVCKIPCCQPDVVCVCKIPCCQPDVVCVCKIPCCQPDVVCV